MEFSTGHIGLWTCVHFWTRVRIRTCPMETSTGHKPFPIQIYIYIYILMVCLANGKMFMPH